VSTINSVVEATGIADPPSGEPSIAAEHLAKRYGETVAVADVTFAVARGEIFGYLGRNGSGKTTTVRMLTTLTRPSSGTARVAGVDIADTRHVREHIGVTMQDAALDDAMTGAAHLRFVAGLSGATRTAARARAAELLELVGLDHVAGARIGTYSGGMKRRLDIASALVGQPRVLFLDEPTTGLDPQSRRAVWDEIRSLRATGVTVFLTTQYIEEADQLADRIAIVDAGAIIAQGTPRELKTAHGRTTVTFEHDGDVSGVSHVLAGTDGIEIGRDARERTVVSLDTATSGTDGTLRILDRIRAAGISPTHLAVSETSLEDVFVRLTGTAINSPAGSTSSGDER
jgi:daunorubicin resistance ABC transporter ATP-binding subunit